MSTYLTISELEHIARLCATLNREVGAIALGDIPLIDSNGEDIGKLTEEQPGWVYQP